MKNISIKKMLMVIGMAFIISFFTSFSSTLNNLNLPKNPTFEDLFIIIEISTVSSIKPGISAVLASILGYLVNNQKGEKVLNNG